ncbi:MAG: hypothetical protein DCF22_18965 [Leptolyngbya sp.]|nr:MAG: hypothetical protein DCF22_18965 [Leptolyngbya sp.]
MRKRFENIFWFVIDNGPTLLTIGFASYVIALAQTSNVPTAIVLQWVLAILGLLAVSELVERLRKIRSIEETTKKTLQVIENKFGERASSDNFFFKRLPRLDTYLEKSSSVCLSGVALQRTIRENIHVLAQLLKDGANVRVVIVNPDSEAAKQIVGAGINYSLETLKANAQSTITHLSWLSALPESKGNVELKFIDEQPHFNIIAIDPEKETGIIFIEITSQRWVSGSRPRFELTPRRDQYWFSYFKAQFDKIWEDSKVVSLKGAPNTKI